jgi:hypothetical protein
VSDRGQIGRLKGAPGQLLVLHGDAASEALRCQSEGHCVIVALGSGSVSRRPTVRLKRQGRREFAEALARMGLDPGKADLDARACGSSPPIWRIWNLYDRSAASALIPGWAKVEHADIVVPAVLAGAWSERSADDLKILGGLAEADYKKVRDALAKLDVMDNRLVERAGDAVICSAPAAAFAFVIDSITPGHLERLATAVTSVFGEIDPQVDLDPDERMYAGMHHKQLPHSEWLRKGLAETLVRIAVIGQPLEDRGVIPDQKSRQQFVNDLVANLPGLRDDARVLASLRDQLPLLAEAAPDPFVEAVEALLHGDRKGLIAMFAEGEESIGGHALHPGLLWAIEMLAWDPDYLSSACLLFAKLAELDPGGRLSNRPLNSLAQVLLAWHPCTNASLDQRIAALDMVIERQPQVGWKLLCQLLPSRHSMAHNTREPIWREAGKSQRVPLTNKLVAGMYKAVVARALSAARNEPDRLVELFDSYGSLSPAHRQELEKLVVEIAKNHETASERRHLLWDKVRSIVHRHQQFADAAWALKGEDLQGLITVMQALTPDDPVTRNQWLFDDQLPELPTERKDFKQVSEDVDRARRDAVADIWKRRGAEGLLGLVRSSRFPGAIASALGELAQDADLLLSLFRATATGDDPSVVFARALSRYAFQVHGDKWTNEVIPLARGMRPPVTAITNAVAHYPDSLETFSLVESLGKEVEEQYWQLHWGVVARENAELQARLIEKLRQHGRARDALYVVASSVREPPPDLAIELLREALVELNAGKAPKHGAIGYWIDQLLEKLRKDARTNKRDLAQVEYAYLPALVQGLERKHLALHEMLATDPTFFIEVLCDLYKGRKEERREQTPELKSRAERAMDLLRSWDHPPGIVAGGGIDAAALNAWVDQARLLAEQTDRAEVADQTIGQVLYFTPPDQQDDAWPHRAVRDLIERIASEHLETGIRLGQFNARGVTSRGPFEGGVQERALANRWRTWADQVGPRWPRSQRLLRVIAEQWEREARREDDEAEQNRIHFD